MRLISVTCTKYTNSNIGETGTDRETIIFQARVQDFEMGGEFL